MSANAPSPASERVIRPRQAWHRLDWARLFHYRDLLFILVRRDFVSRYQQTILGPVWFILQPLITTVAFTVVFGRVLRTPTDGVPPFLFYLCGTLGWSYFSNVLSGTGNTFQANAGIFTKVYFPRLIMPLSVILSSLMSFAVQAVTFLVFYFAFALANPVAALHPNIPALVLLPLTILQAAGLALGCGLLFSALSAKYRDFQHVLPFVAQIWMFATPIIYPLSQLGARARWFAVLNPMTTVVESFRIAFFGVGTISAGYLALSVTTTLVVLLAGFALFQGVERTVADTI